MELSDRIKTILSENELKQKNFAHTIGVTESYISAMVNSRINTLSQSLAKLIEEKYGYAAEWVLTGALPKLKQTNGVHGNCSDLHKKAILRLEKMSDRQVKAVLAFINSLDEIESLYNTR